MSVSVYRFIKVCSYLSILTDKQTEGKGYRQTDGQTDRLKRKGYIQTDRREKDLYRQTEEKRIYTDRQTDRLIEEKI